MAAVAARCCKAVKSGPCSFLLDRAAHRIESNPLPSAYACHLTQDRTPTPVPHPCSAWLAQNDEALEIETGGGIHEVRANYFCI
jgi:hypothetical protein